MRIEPPALRRAIRALDGMLPGASEAFDATLLLVADWDEKAKPPQVTSIDQPATELGVSRFFEDVIHFVTDRSPIKEHVEVRRRRSPEPIGGLPDEDDPPYAADE